MLKAMTLQSLSSCLCQMAKTMYSMPKFTLMPHYLNIIQTGITGQKVIICFCSIKETRLAMLMSIGHTILHLPSFSRLTMTREDSIRSIMPIITKQVDLFRIML